MEGTSVIIIDMASSSNMEHNSIAIRGGTSTGVISTGFRSCVISAVVIPIHHICVGDGRDADSSNANNAEHYIVL